MENIMKKFFLLVETENIKLDKNIDKIRISRTTKEREVFFGYYKYEDIVSIELVKEYEDWVVLIRLKYSVQKPLTLLRYSEIKNITSYEDFFIKIYQPLRFGLDDMSADYKDDDWLVGMIKV